MRPTFRFPDAWASSPPDRDAVQEWELSCFAQAEVLGLRRVLLQASMGTGKTRLAAKMAQRMESSGRRMVFLVHLKTLIEQSERTFRDWGVDVQVEQGPRKARRPFDRKPFHVIASKDSLRPARLEDFLARTRFRDHPLVVVADECHLATSPSFLEPIAGLSPVFTVGLSGTPMRLDGKPLVGPGAPFEALVCRYDFLSGCRHGNLVPPVFVECQGRIDLRGIAITRQVQGKDYDPKALVARINENLGHVCRAARDEMELMDVRRALAFLPDIATCRAAETMWAGLGYRCRAIYGDMPDRDTVKRMYHDGHLDILVSCQMLDVGFDDPPTDGVILATPTKSPVKALQQGGRGSRLFPGKTRYVAIGYRWEDDEEGPQSTLDLLLRGVPDEDVRRRARAALLGRRGQNLLEALDQAEREVAQEREEARRRLRELPVACTDAPAHYRRRVIDPMSGSAGALEPALVRRLVACGLDKAEVGGWSPRRSEEFLAQWEDRHAAGMSSYNQVKRLIGWGWDRAQALALTVREAQSEIWRARKDRWGGRRVG